MKILYFPLCIVIFLATAFNCKENSSADDIAMANNETESTSSLENKTSEVNQQFNDYWYAGEAEISSFQLSQARYGELREGTAALIFVTEDFLPDVQVKADQQNTDNVSVLKLNSTKNFNTGIYPYSIMQSAFYPVANNQHAIKVSCSVQEWCGQVYTQLNNRSKFDIVSHSYFQSEADEHLSLKKEILENQLWNQLRIDPKSLPVGKHQIIPSLEFIRLKHIELKAYEAEAKLSESTYAINYPELNRRLVITFNPDFPYDIESWEETFNEGSKPMTTTAKRLKLIKSAYWTKNSVADDGLRDTLKLD